MIPSLTDIWLHLQPDVAVTEMCNTNVNEGVINRSTDDERIK